MDAVFLLVMGAGAILMYEAYKGGHPWQLWQAGLKTSATTPPGR